MSASLSISFNAPQQTVSRQPIKISDEAKQQAAKYIKKADYLDKKADDYRAKAKAVITNDYHRQTANYNNVTPITRNTQQTGQTGLTISGGNLPNIKINL